MPFGECIDVAAACSAATRSNALISFAVTATSSVFMSTSAHAVRFEAVRRADMPGTDDIVRNVAYYSITHEVEFEAKADAKRTNKETVE
jgi:hypothetical protein